MERNFSEMFPFVNLIRIYDFDKRFKMATRANSGILLAEP
jgi:hypothetical protein